MISVAVYPEGRASESRADDLAVVDLARRLEAEAEVEGLRAPVARHQLVYSDVSPRDRTSSAASATAALPTPRP